MFETYLIYPLLILTGFWIGRFSLQLSTLYLRWQFLRYRRAQVKDHSRKAHQRAVEEALRCARDYRESKRPGTVHTFSIRPADSNGGSIRWRASLHLTERN